MRREKKKKETVLIKLNSRLIINSNNSVMQRRCIGAYSLSPLRQKAFKGKLRKTRIIRVNTINCHDLFHPV